MTLSGGVKTTRSRWTRTAIQSWLGRLRSSAPAWFMLKVVMSMGCCSLATGLQACAWSKKSVRDGTHAGITDLRGRVPPHALPKPEGVKAKASVPSGPAGSETLNAPGQPRGPTCKRQPKRKTEIQRQEQEEGEHIASRGSNKQCVGVDDHGRRLCFNFNLNKCQEAANGALWKYTLLVSTVMCYVVPACNWYSGCNMMLLMFSLCRTLEMMQNDVRTSGIG